MPSKKVPYRKPYLRHPFERLRVPIDLSGPSLVDQSQGDATDINKIVTRYARTGQLPGTQAQAVYADVTDLQGDLTDRLIWAEKAVQTANKELAEIRKAQAQAEEKVNVDKPTETVQGVASDGNPGPATETSEKEKA